LISKFLGNYILNCYRNKPLASNILGIDSKKVAPDVRPEVRIEDEIDEESDEESQKKLEDVRMSNFAYS